MKTIFLVLDHGLALAYFLETDLVNLLAEKNARLVLLVPEAMLPLLQDKYSNPRIIFESVRDKQALRYQKSHCAGLQELFDHVRRASASRLIPLTYVDTHRRRREMEARGRRKRILPLLRPLIGLLRRSRLARLLFRHTLQIMFTPHIYADLFERYQPELIVCNTAGWRLDQYLLREAKRRGIETATVIVGWDNPSSQGLPGAFIDYIVVWSEIHKWEMVAGVDWPPEKVFIGGMPLYDGYISRKWVMPRDEYFRLHHLDPHKQLIAFAATALSISPNLHLVKLLSEMIGKQTLKVPSQLLIRLHPNHFKTSPHYQEEARAIYEIARQFPDVHVVEPKEVPGGFERYSGEDFPEKGSMLAHCDLLVTIYSTMVVEAALHDKPFISACIDTPGGWQDKFWVPLHEVPGWPTASRVNRAKAGKLVLTPEELRQALDEYLSHPDLNATERRQLVEAELTFLNGEATRRTADYLWSLACGDKE